MLTGFVNALAILIFLAQVPELINVPWATYPMVAAGPGHHLPVATDHHGGAGARW